MLLLARWVVPVSSPPIENGAVVVEKDRIIFVGTRHAVSLKTEPVLDLKDSVLFPGLVNAHCHLEFSPLQGKIEPGLSFTEWVKEVSYLRAVNPPHPPLTKGGRGDFLLRGGTTTVADHCHSGHPETVPFETPFRTIRFWEVLGAHPERARQSLADARRRAREEGGFVTPHSLYAVHEEVLEEIFSAGATPRGCPLQSVHILESSDEEQFFRRQSGPLAIYVQERGGDLSFPVSSPVKWLAASHWLGGLGRNLLLVHGNYLNSEEIDLIKRCGAGVVHSPGSHRFFGHRRFPLEELREKGIPIALGTDSLASNEDLSMLREMALLREGYPDLRPEEILRMATLHGASLLKMDREIGSLEVEKKADLCAVPWGQGSDPFESLFRATQVSLIMIDGKVVLKTP